MADQKTRPPNREYYSVSSLDALHEGGTVELVKNLREAQN